MSLVYCLQLCDELFKQYTHLVALDEAMPLFMHNQVPQNMPCFCAVPLLASHCQGKEFLSLLRTYMRESTARLVKTYVPPISRFCSLLAPHVEALPLSYSFPQV
jgi:hypothetical protein